MIFTGFIRPENAVAIEAPLAMAAPTCRVMMPAMAPTTAPTFSPKSEVATSVIRFMMIMAAIALAMAPATMAAVPERPRAPPTAASEPRTHELAAAAPAGGNQMEMTTMIAIRMIANTPVWYHFFLTTL